MDGMPPQPDLGSKRSETAWARPVSRLKPSDIPAGGIALNLDGHQVIGPLQGFGQMWLRTYRVRLSGVKVTPQQVIADWKANFPLFQPTQNHFYPTLTGILPGEILYINSVLPIGPGLPGIIPMKSGVMVLYADDELFTVMTPEGFPISGWNTFSAFEDDHCVVAQVQGLVRTSDPIYEFGFRYMGGEMEEDRTWFHVLLKLAEHWGVKGQVQFHKELLDPKVQWNHAGNIWKNAAIRTFFYILASPFRWMGNKIGHLRADGG
jgi:hypothetical protein